MHVITILNKIIIIHLHRITSHSPPIRRRPELVSISRVRIPQPFLGRPLALEARAIDPVLCVRRVLVLAVTLSHLLGQAVLALRVHLEPPFLIWIRTSLVAAEVAVVHDRGQAGALPEPPDEGVAHLTVIVLIVLTLSSFYVYLYRLLIPHPLSVLLLSRNFTHRINPSKYFPVLELDPNFYVSKRHIPIRNIITYYYNCTIEVS